jgi:hypothetical protein
VARLSGGWRPFSTGENPFVDLNFRARLVATSVTGEENLRAGVGARLRMWHSCAVDIDAVTEEQS